MFGPINVRTIVVELINPNKVRFCTFKAAMYIKETRRVTAPLRIPFILFDLFEGIAR